MFGPLVDSITKRFENLEAEIVKIVIQIKDALVNHNERLNFLEQQHVQTQKLIKDLQGQGVEKILLEESEEVGKN